MYMYVYNMLLMQCETWCMYMGDKFVDKSIESYYTYECIMASCHTYKCVMSHIWMHISHL